MRCGARSLAQRQHLVDITLPFSGARAFPPTSFPSASRLCALRGDTAVCPCAPNMGPGGGQAVSELEVATFC